MTLQKNMLDIFEIMKNDEKLLRLLHYPAQNDVVKILNPLDEKLPNILSMSVKERDALRDKYIYKIPKTDDLLTSQICRIYVYAGRRSTTNGNFLYADQNIVFDILVHDSFENGDLRTTRIAERLNELFTLEHITGIGKMTYEDGNILGSPKNYIGYKHIFKIVESHKGGY